MLDDRQNNNRDAESITPGMLDRPDMPEVKPNPNIEAAVREILTSIGEDVNREGLLNTPNRVARMYQELMAGYQVDQAGLINNAIFEETYDQMVIVKDIDFYSLCEHHLLPFMGKAHVAYLPNGKIIGLSKIPRIVEMFARRLQVQERMTTQIANLLQETLQPHGVGVVIEAVHLCAAMRGVKQPNARMITSAMLGDFRFSQNTRNELLALIGRGSAQM